MLRFIFNAMTLLSLLIFVLATLFWVRGQFASDGVIRRTFSSSWRVSTSRSGVELMCVEDSVRIAATIGLAPGEVNWRTANLPPQSYSESLEFGTMMSANESGPQFEWLHIVWLRHPVRAMFGTGSVVFIHLPFWLLLLLSVPLPAMWLKRRRSLPHRRRRFGLCVHCGYDLRGVDARCPECGLPSGYATSPAPQPGA